MRNIVPLRGSKARYTTYIKKEPFFLLTTLLLKLH